MPSQPGDRQVGAYFFSRAAGDVQVVGKVPVGLLSESFRDVSRNTPCRGASLSLQIPIAGSLEAVRDGRNCIGRGQGLLVNEQFLDAGRHHSVGSSTFRSRLPTADCRLPTAD